MRDIALSRGWYPIICKRKNYRYGKRNKDAYTVEIKYNRTNQCHLKPISDNEYGGYTKKYDEYHYVGDVYDLSVADDYSFVANGMLVHNCIDSLSFAIECSNLRGLIDWKKVPSKVMTKREYWLKTV